MDKLAFSVGGLLYTPADSDTVATHILREDWPALTAVCLCLEDAIQDAALQDAEARLARTLDALRQGEGEAAAARPLLFVRVRTPEHLARVHARLGAGAEALTGYVFPKFDLSNGESFLKELARINEGRARPFFAMPILESRQIARAATRQSALSALRELLDAHRGDVLNVRVGGNDFCNIFALRRTVRQSIYDLGVVRDILVDIVNTFSDDYVVSGPVWEYYGARPGAWEAGLRREMELDLANGFFGKTAIHPSQLPVIRDGLKAGAADVADARQILGWSDEKRAVAGSAASGRMNELKCHARWAQRILLRAELYGIREEAGAGE